MGEDPNSKEINVNMLDETESVQDRINRVKAGKMTPEEKEAFLRTALSTGNTPESRLPLRKPVPIYEVNPNNETRAMASPFPEDPILRSIAGGKDPGPAALTRQFIDKSGIDSQKKKREYLDMVTDPHRFDVFRTQASDARTKSPLVSNEANATETQKELATAPEQPTSLDDSTDSTPPPSLANTPQDMKFPSSDLAERLEAAAIAQEQQRKQQEEEKAKQEEQEEERKREATAKAEEEELRRQKLLEQREKEYRERRKKEEEEEARTKAKRKEEEDKRLKVLMDAQESYWQQKLAKEREVRQKMLSEPQKKLSVPTETPVVAPVPVQAPSASTPPKVPSPTVDTNNRFFNPDESDLLNDTINLPRKQKESASPPSVRPFLNDVPNARTTTQTKPSPSRRSKKDEEMDEQLKRLKELNSPLPELPPLGRKEYHKKRSPVSFEPQRAVSGLSSRRSSFPTSGGAGIKAATPPVIETPPPAPAFRAPPSPAADAKTTGSNPLSTLFGTQPSAMSSNVSSKPRQPAEAALNSVRSPPETPKRKGPIRMQLPLEEEDGFDEEEGIDAAANQQMSIKDALKKSGDMSDIDPQERSKKWYVSIQKMEPPVVPRLIVSHY
jgi:hypothetical protein